MVTKKVQNIKLKTPNTTQSTRYDMTEFGHRLSWERHFSGKNSQIRLNHKPNNSLSKNIHNNYNQRKSSGKAKALP
ncbi:MAG: hypothetical protein AABZ13_08990 [Planctomycetota bacterium]|jgi:hypothetical protein